MVKKFDQWTKEEMLQAVKDQMPEKRYIHTLGVVQAAKELAGRYGVDPYEAEIAAIFHDYAKFRDESEMVKIIKHTADIPNDLLDYHKELWHAPVGAQLVQKEIGIEHKDILNAIRFHTTGRPGMSLLEKVVCLADYIEPGRKFIGLEEVRELALKDIDRALALALSNTIQFLQQQGQEVYPLTISAYEFLRVGLGHTNGKKGERLDDECK
ncbi:bis(5'-nucleosyl)-tetraphosphatase (symmetrical) YqeK [Bacillus horti]|uniref:bis(5'-nucleosyl)-tetraphosphatase (symmetrical) n=1 Tax=Caldalkalibacillus horti TaxID=77523 RepID=A0ABT9VU32_9BACI|nr:bis(5'-nucleosyl)-tetraphosphatase (symmetrical) YqeK [Bacillus horti]MDQ0164130.1 putative HD superfamily hydrolase involved in NAD metabolism [Bacillus horti]